MDEAFSLNGVGGEGVEPMVSRSELPIELIAHILYFLDLRELVLCRQLSKSFRNLIDDSTLLQYKLNLTVARCIDGPCTKTDLASRLWRLQRSQAAWGTLQWTRAYDFPVLEDSCAHISGSVLAQMNPECDLVCSQLPSPHRNIPQKDWKFNGFGFFVVEYAVDHARDLLVLVKETTHDNRKWFMELVFLSLGTGEPHPLAPETPIMAPIEDRDLEEDRCMDILISDNYIGMMVYEDIETRFTELWVWDWPKGDTVLNLYGDLMDGWSSRSFMFVAAGRLLVPTLVPEGNSDIDVPRLPLIDLAVADSGRHTYEYAYTYLAFAIFEMPKQKPGVACARLDLFGKPYSTHGTHDALGVPFYADPRFQLLAFRLWMLQANNAFRQYTLFASAETFQRLSTSWAEKGEGRVVVPWEAWAAEARIVPLIRTMHHAHLSQMRCVSATPAEDGTKRTSYLCVYDFASLRALRREMAEHERSGKPAGDIEYFVEPTAVDAPDIWVGEVKTGLPYKKTVSYVVLNAGSGYQINEDCVVVRQVTPKETCEVLTC